MASGTLSRSFSRGRPLLSFVVRAPADVLRPVSRLGPRATLFWPRRVGVPSIVLHSSAEAVKKCNTSFVWRGGRRRRRVCLIPRSQCAADQWRRPSCESNRATVINNERHNQQGRRAPLYEAAEWETSGEGSRHCASPRRSAVEKMIRGTAQATAAGLTQWQEVAVGIASIHLRPQVKGSLSICTLLTFLFRLSIFFNLKNCVSTCLRVSVFAFLLFCVLLSFHWCWSMQLVHMTM